MPIAAKRLTTTLIQQGIAVTMVRNAQDKQHLGHPGEDFLRQPILLLMASLHLFCPAQHCARTNQQLAQDQRAVTNLEAVNNK